jgi:hypothetical protein
LKFIILTSLLFAAHFSLAQTAPKAKIQSCKKWLQGFQVWEDEDKNGRLYFRHSIFSLGDWDPMNTQFDGVILVRPLPAGFENPVFEIEFQPKDGKGKAKIEKHSKLLPWSRIPTYRQFDTFNAEDFFNLESSGTYTIRLKSGGKTLCSDSNSFRLGHG